MPSGAPVRARLAGKRSLGAAVEGAQGLCWPGLVACVQCTLPGHNTHPFLPLQTLIDSSRSVVWVSLSHYVRVLFHGCVQ